MGSWQRSFFVFHGSQEALFRNFRNIQKLSHVLLGNVVVRCHCVGSWPVVFQSVVATQNYNNTTFFWSKTAFLFRNFWTSMGMLWSLARNTGLIPEVYVISNTKYSTQTSAQKHPQWVLSVSKHVRLCSGISVQFSLFLKSTKLNNLLDGSVKIRFLLRFRSPNWTVTILPSTEQVVALLVVPGCMVSLFWVQIWIFYKFWTEIAPCREKSWKNICPREVTKCFLVPKETHRRTFTYTCMKLSWLPDMGHFSHVFVVFATKIERKIQNATQLLRN